MIKVKQLFKMLFLLMAIISLSACSKEDSGSSDPVGTKSLQVTPGRLHFTAAGGTQQLQVKTSYGYYGYKITADWLKAGFSDDNTKNIINITAEPNKSTSARTATIRVTGGNSQNSTDESVNIIIEQEGESSSDPEGKTTVIPATGGTIVEGDISLSFPEGAFSSDTKVTLSEANADEIVGNEAQKSAFYTITLGGPSEKEFSLTLKGKDTDGQTRAVRRSDGVNLHTGSTLEYTIPVDATVKDGAYTVTIPKIECEAGDKPRFTMGLATVPTSETAKTRADSPGCEVSWSWKWIFNSTDKEIVNRTKEYAEEAFAALAKLGYEKPNRKVPYIIQQVNGSWGNHIQSKYFNSDNYIELNESKFKNLLSASEKDLQELRRTLIHETSHYYHQQVYDKRSAPVKTARGLMGDEWTMLSESLGGWTEKQTAPYEMDYNVYQERESFIKHFIPYNINMNTSIAHGYSMGVAIEYLAKHTSDKEIVKLLQYQRDQKATTLRGCYDLFLREHNMTLFDYTSYGSFLTELFKEKIDARINLDELANPMTAANAIGFYSDPIQLKGTIYDWGADINKFKVKTSDLASVDGKIISVKEEADGIRTEVYTADMRDSKNFKLIGTAEGKDSVVISDLKQFETNQNMVIYLVTRKVNEDGKTTNSNTTIKMIEGEKADFTIGSVSFSIFSYTDLTVYHGEVDEPYTKTSSDVRRTHADYFFADDLWPENNNLKTTAKGKGLHVEGYSSSSDPSYGTTTIGKISFDIDDLSKGIAAAKIINFEYTVTETWKEEKREFTSSVTNLIFAEKSSNESWVTWEGDDACFISYSDTDTDPSGYKATWAYKKNAENKISFTINQFK